MYIVSPKDGAKVKGPVTVVFGLKGMGVAPAGIAWASPEQADTSSAGTSVIVEANPAALPLGNVLRGAGMGAGVARFSWFDLAGGAASAFRLYRHADKAQIPAGRAPVGEITASMPPELIDSTPPALGFYQVVGVSCDGSSEGPY